MIAWSCVLFLLLILYDPQRILAMLSRVKPCPRVPQPMRALVRCIRSVCKRNPLARRRPCLHRSLLLYRFLKLHGYVPALHIGFPLKRSQADYKDWTDNVHAWVTVDREVVLDSPANCTGRYRYYLWTVSGIHYWASVE